MVVMGKKEAMEALKPSLTEAIQKWMDYHCESDEWTSLDVCVGNDLNCLMSDAAFAVFAGVVDSHSYLREEGYLNL